MNSPGGLAGKFLLSNGFQFQGYSPASSLRWTAIDMGLTAAGAGAVLFFRGFVLAPFTQLRLSSVVVGESQERCHGGRSYFVLDVVKTPSEKA